MVIVADKNGGTDGSAYELVSRINSPVPIVLVAWTENFVFNDDLHGLEDYILVCFAEYGWNWDLNKSGSHIWGDNSWKFERYYNGDWVKFDDWVKENPPKIFFKRELLKQDVTDTILPIEYPCKIDAWPMQLRHEFNERPIDFFQYWGRSNECRLRIHGEIWLDAFKKGYQVCDNIYYINHYLEHERGKKAITLWIPHYERIDINHLMGVNAFSKLSLSWPGAGFKCFRTHEAPVNSVLVQHKNNFAWQHDWDETNCILVEPEKELDGINEALDNHKLYDIYLEGMKNVDRYRTSNYVKHLEEEIKKRL